jgi:hypothetical protein
LVILRKETPEFALDRLINLTSLTYGSLKISPQIGQRVFAMAAFYERPSAGKPLNLPEGGRPCHAGGLVEVFRSERAIAELATDLH